MPYAHLAVTMHTLRYWFLKQSTLREVLAMLCKIIRPLTSNPVYPVILVPEAINPEGAISYAMQNHVPTYQLPCVPGDTDS